MESIKSKYFCLLMEANKKYIIVPVNGINQKVIFVPVNGINQKVNICAC